MSGGAGAQEASERELPIVRSPGEADQAPGHDHYRMLSMAYSVRAIDEGFRDALRWHLAPFRRPGPDAHGISITMTITDEDAGLEEPWYSLFVGYEMRFRHRLLTEMLSRAVWEMHALVPKYTRDFVLLHAGGVVRYGRAWLLPARMNAGKSSLVAQLLSMGLGYLSDELGAIDPITGRAYPFPKRISLDWPALSLMPGLTDRLGGRPELTRHLAQTFVTPEELGSSPAGPTPVSLLVFPTAEWGGPPRLSSVSRAEAVELMAADAFNLYRYGDRGVLLLSRISQEAPAFRLEGGSPRERAQLLLERLS